MNIRELICYSRRLLRGKRWDTALVCLLPAMAVIFFRLAEICTYSLMLYFGKVEPIGLFTGNEPFQLAAALIFTLLRWIVTAPLILSMAYRLHEICSERPAIRRTSDIISTRKLFRRSISALLWNRIISLAGLIPAVFFGVAAWNMLPESRTPGKLFLTSHALLLTGFSLFMWISLKLSLSAVPFLLAEFPEMTAFQASVHAVRFMKGRKSFIVRLAALYALPVITVIAAPLALTELLTALSLGISIYVKEADYAASQDAERSGIYGNTALHSRKRLAADCSGFSHEGTRRFKKTSH